MFRSAGKASCFGEGEKAAQSIDIHTKNLFITFIEVFHQNYPLVPKKTIRYCDFILTYGIELSEGARVYQQKVLASEPVKRWLREASIENDIVEKDEAGEAV